MRTVGLAEAKAQLSALLDAVEAGDEVVITRRGTAVARLVREPADRTAAKASWAERLRTFHKNQELLGVSAVSLVRDLRDQG